MSKKIKNTRIKIAEAALSCFIKKGIIETTYKDIAAKAKVHQPLIKYYYKNFEELFADVLGLLIEDLKNSSVEAMDRHPDDPTSALLEYSIAPLEWAEAKPQYTPIWTFFYHMTSYSPVFLGLNNNLRETGLNRISLLVYRILEERNQTLKKGWSVKDLAYAIQTHITGALVMGVTQEKNISEAKDQCQMSLSALIEGAIQFK